MLSCFYAQVFSHVCILSCFLLPPLQLILRTVTLIIHLWNFSWHFTNSLHQISDQHLLQKKRDNNSICFIFKRYGSRKWHVWSWFLASESKSISNSSLPIGLIILLSWSDKFSKKCYHSSFFCLGPAVVLTRQWFL